METVSNLNKFFSGVFEDLNCDPKTKAYIANMFAKFNTTTFDLSNKSITLTYHEAKRKHDFMTYQLLGDWIFFCRVEFPEHLIHASEDYYITVGQISYYSCYRLINRQWMLFEQLADQFRSLEQEARLLLAKNVSSRIVG